MDSLTLQQLAAMSGGFLEGDASLVLSRVITDSRSAQAGDLFVALRGERFDGHAFLSEVASRGVKAALVDGACREIPAGFSVIRVPETLAGLQQLAAEYRKTLPARIVGITGSSGKTTTKDFTFSVLSQRMTGWCTSGNLNNHIGVPLTLLSGNREAQMAVVEMGMNHAGEIAPLAAMSRPEVGIITNIGVAHIEFLGSQHAIAVEKGALAAAVDVSGTVVLPAAEPFSGVIERMTDACILRAGLSCGDVQAVDVQPMENGSRFALVYEGMRAEVELAVPGLHMVQNAALSAAAGIALGVPLEAAADGLRGMKLTKGRMESRLPNGPPTEPESQCSGAWANSGRLPRKATGRLARLQQMASIGSLQLESRLIGSRTRHGAMARSVSIILVTSTRPPRLCGAKLRRAMWCW